MSPAAKLPLHPRRRVLRELNPIVAHKQRAIMEPLPYA
jgi:hypothetical protein